VADNYHKLMLFDSRTRQWAQLAEGHFIAGSPYWSKDATCVYYQDTLVPGQPVYCARPKDGKKNVVVTFEQILRGSANSVSFHGPAPEGSLLIILQRNYSDVYALDLELP